MRKSTNRCPTTNKTNWDPNKIKNCNYPNHNIKIKRALATCALSRELWLNLEGSDVLRSRKHMYTLCGCYSQMEWHFRFLNTLH